VDVTREYTDTTDDDTYAYMPRYLDIQVGVEKGQLLPIRLWDLNTTTLRCRVPEEISAHAAGDSIQYLKHALNKVSGIRSYYGATTNRLEHAAKNNANVSENTAAAESRIRDTDMALEMVSYSNNSILMQSGQSMLAQANSSPERILQLLSSN
jgi:flagellin